MDNEGTPINISPHLTLNEHRQAVKLIKEFIHLFTVIEIAGILSTGINSFKLVLTYR